LDPEDMNGNQYNMSFFGADLTTDHRRLELIYEPCLAEHAWA
jgi:hypothetical protein